MLHPETAHLKNAPATSTSNVSVHSVQFSLASHEHGKGIDLGPPAQQPPARRRRSILPTKKDAHWVSRKVMIGCFLLGVALFVGHHAFFSSLVGQMVDDEFAQQKTRLYVPVLLKPSHLV